MAEERKSLYDRLRDNNLTYVWLISILDKVGIRTDKSEMSSAVRGTISGDKAERIINTSHQILDQYDQFLRSLEG